MPKLLEIVKGWLSLYGGVLTDEAAARLKVCDPCEFKQPWYVASMLPEQTDGTLKKSQQFRCTLCGCNVAAKALNPQEKCPANKWPK